MSKDTTLERIWEARRRIYERCGNDPVKLVEYYRNCQQEQLSQTPIDSNRHRQRYALPRLSKKVDLSTVSLT
jgi:hypothetical protein